jgi:hypothetical protein
MKIFTQTVLSTGKPELQDKIRKTILMILFISLAVTALADSVQLFSDLSSCTPYFYECDYTRTSSSTSVALY